MLTGTGRDDMALDLIPDRPGREAAFEPLLDELVPIFCPGWDNRPDEVDQCRSGIRRLIDPLTSASPEPPVSYPCWRAVRRSRHGPYTSNAPISMAAAPAVTQ